MAGYPVNRLREIFVLCTIASGMVYGQSQNQPSRRRDQKAVSIITSAITILGGDESYASITDVSAEGNCTGKSQAADSLKVFAFKWIVAGEEYRYEKIMGGSTNVTASGHGSPVNSAADGVKKISSFQRRLPYHIPGLLLYKELQDSRYAFLYKGQKQLDGQTLDWIEISAAMGAGTLQPLAQEWFFASDGYPYRVYYYSTSEHSINRHLLISLSFSHFEKFHGLMQPSMISTAIQNKSQLECLISNLSINTKPDPSIFDLH